MKINRRVHPIRLVGLASTLALALCACLPAVAQNVNAAQQVTLAGLRSSSGRGAFPGSAYAPDGSLILLYNAGDGVRVLKLNAAGTAILAQALLGAAGDVPVALAVDSSGNLYVTGTSSSAVLSGTAGAAFPTRADTSINSFLARLNPDLSTGFVTFLGAGRTAVTGVTATADAAFVTGVTYSTTFPVTSAGIEQSPRPNSSQNGFVERFSPSGSLVYATYLTGANGNTSPTSIAADNSDSAYIAGSTTATGYPTNSALVPNILGESSGFLSKLSPAGDGFLFSTFIPGSGITGLAIDSNRSTLLLTGNVSIGQFPIATVYAPIAPTAYQSLLRIPLDGQSVTSSTLLVPGSQSSIAAGPSGSSWINGVLTVPLFPGTSQPIALFGDGFALHLTSTGALDQTLRFGASAPLSSTNPFFLSTGQPAVAPDATVALPSTLSANVSATTAATQTFDIPLVNAPNPALPNTFHSVASTCTGSQCYVTTGYLVAANPTSSGPSLSLSVDSFPNVILRNLGTATANGLAISASGFTTSTTCGSSLAPSNPCTIALTGSGPGTLTVSAIGAPTQTVSLPATTLPPDPLAISPVELDFGLLSAAAGATSRTLTVANLSATTQTFSSAPALTAKNLPYTLAEGAGNCPNTGTGLKTLAPGASCRITLSLTASTNPLNDGIVRTAWKVGNHYLPITAITQAASLTVSASEVDFGTQFQFGLHLPRFLYLSNAGPTLIAHAAVTLPASSPFSVTDECPSLIEPHSVCRLTLNYASPTAPSADTDTLSLDQGLTVLLTGRTLPPASATAASANPSLSVSPTSITFTAPVTVTGVSGTTQAVTIRNTGATAVPLTISITGDFSISNGCPATLTGGSSCQLLVSFTPSQPGVRNGLLAITGGASFAPAYVPLTGTGTAILPPNNGTLDVGQTRIGEPIVAWYKLQQSLPSLSASTSSPNFTVAIVEDLGYGHGNPPPSTFSQSATGTCNNCWLGVQFLAQTPGTQAASLLLSTVTGGKPYTLTLTGTALPVTGLVLSPLTQDFGPVPVNSSSAPRTATLANLLIPAADTTITSVSTTGNFALVTNATGGASCTGTLASTATCFIQIVFAPTATGLRTGTLTVVTSSGTVTTALTGFGLTDTGLALNPSELDFDNVPGTASTQQTITVSNTGAVPLTLGPLSTTDPSFNASTTCSTLAPGSTCSITVTFTPGSAPVSATLNIPATSTINGQTTTTNYTVSLQGRFTAEEAGLQIVPDAVNFGTTAVGDIGLTRQFTLNNLTSKTLTVSFSMPRQFPLTAAPTCATLAPNASCTFSVLFAPLEAGEATGSIYAQATPSDGSPNLQAIAYMQGYGSSTATLRLTGANLIPNAPLNFGQLPSGQSTTQTLTITNTGSGTLNIRRILSEPPFLSSSTCTSPLAPAATCTITLTYAPTYQVASGASTLVPRSDAGTLTILSDADSSPDVLQLTGQATAVNSGSPSSSGTLATYQLSTSAVTFSSTGVGNQSSAQTFTLTNTGSTTLHLLGLHSSPDFSTATTCTVLQPADTCSITITFTPTTASASSTRSSALEISTDAANSLEYVSLLGTSSPAPLTLSPTALDFGTVAVGASSSLPVTVTNTTAAAITFTGLAASGDYTVAAGNCPSAGSTLAANSSCTLQVTFTPAATGTRSGILSVSTSATTLPLTVSLTGNGVLAHLTASPSALAFGDIAIGSPAQLTFTLTNTGTTVVSNIVSTLSGSNAADFAVTTPCSSSSLAPNQACTVTVTFTPSALGARSATLRIASSDPASPLSLPLSGNGVAAGTFTLTVNGGSSASATVKSGSPATFDLTVTPVNGYAGTVALTCTAITAGSYVTCSISPSQIVLNGAPQNSTVTLNTITSAALDLHATHNLIAFAALVPLLFSRRIRRFRHRLTLSAAVCITLVLGNSILGCGGGQKNKYLLTPPGTYQYQVTASSTSGTVISKTVTLTLIVQ